MQVLHRPPGQRRKPHDPGHCQMIVPGSFVRRTYVLTSLCLLAAGLGWIFGPEQWRSDPSYSVAAEIWTVFMWGFTFTLVGIFKLMTVYVFGVKQTLTYSVLKRRREAFRLGSVLGGTLSMLWAAAMTAALIIGKIDQWGVIPAWYCIGAVQLLSAASVWER